MTDEEHKIQNVMDYKYVFTSPEGQRVLEDLKRAMSFNSALIPMGVDNHIDVYEVMRNEGKRAVIIYIERKLNIDLKKPEQREAVNSESE